MSERAQTSLFLFDTLTRRQIQLHDRMVFGRTTGAVLFEFDNLVSGKHFEVRLGPDNMVGVVDLGSRNKTLVNGRPIDVGQVYELRIGDVITFGNQRLVFGKTDQIPARRPKMFHEQTNHRIELEGIDPNKPRQLSHFERQVGGHRPTRDERVESNWGLAAFWRDLKDVRHWDSRSKMNLKVSMVVAFVAPLAFGTAIQSPLVSLSVALPPLYFAGFGAGFVNLYLHRAFARMNSGGIVRKVLSRLFTASATLLTLGILISAGLARHQHTFFALTTAEYVTEHCNPGQRDPNIVSRCLYIFNEAPWDESRLLYRALNETNRKKFEAFADKYRGFNQPAGTTPTRAISSE